MKLNFLIKPPEDPKDPWRMDVLVVKDQKMDDAEECVKLVEEYERPHYHQIVNIMRKWSRAQHA